MSTYEYISGINSVTDTLIYSKNVKLVYVSDSININKNKRIKNIIDIANSNKIKVQRTNKFNLNQICNSESHQGIAAKVDSFVYSSLDNVINKINNSTSDKSLILILDHIQDSGNLGAIIRSAEACNADCVIIPNKRSVAITPTTYKTSVGAINNIDIVKVSNLNATINKLKNNAFWIYGASEHAENTLWQSNLKGKVAFIFGSEYKGISSLVLKNCDMKVKLPILGNVESLNVAQTSSIFCYEWVRQNLHDTK